MRDGKVSVFVNIGQSREMRIDLANIVEGEVFGWSALISPHQATSSVKATTPCRVVAFDCRELRKTFKDDCEFGFLMIEKVAQIVRDRLRDMRVESLAHMVLE